MATDLGIEERLRRKMARPPRSKSIAIRFTEAEAAAIAGGATKRGLAVCEWAREVLLESAQTTRIDNATFTELMALRLLINGVLRELALGRPMTEKQYDAHLVEARKTKHQTARDVLAQYQPSSEGER